MWTGRDKGGNFYRMAHVYQCQQLMKEFGLEVAETDHKKDICLRKTYEVNLTKEDPIEEGVVIYTDGSKMDQGVGYGYHYDDEEYGY